MWCRHHQCQTKKPTKRVSSRQSISPAALHSSEASPSRKKCSSIFNAKPTAAATECSSIFNAKPTRPVHSIPKPFLASPFIQQKPHSNPRYRMFQHLQCEAHRTISAADVQHGSSHTKTLLAQPQVSKISHLIKSKILTDQESALCKPEK